MQNSMLMIESSWNSGKTFRMIPIHKDCPYNEAIFDAQQNVLAVISKECKQTLQLVPRFTEKGDVDYLKTPRQNGKNYAEERRTIDTWYEYYIENVYDIETFISHFAVNSADFDWKKYLPKADVTQP